MDRLTSLTVLSLHGRGPHGELNGLEGEVFRVSNLRAASLSGVKER